MRGEGRNGLDLFWILTVLLVATALSACDTARVEELEAEVADLRQQLAEATSTTTRTVAKSANITGIVMLRGDGFAPRGATSDGRCWGIGAYKDIVAGATVLVDDSTGVAIAAGFLEGGVRTSDGCELHFTLEVPADLDSYTIEVKNVADFSFSLVELKARGWFVELALG